MMILFSDRGIPDGYRCMHGYGSNTFKLVNANNIAVYCKFHYRVTFITLFNTLLPIMTIGIIIFTIDKSLTFKNLSQLRWKASDVELH